KKFRRVQLGARGEAVGNVSSAEWRGGKAPLIAPGGPRPQTGGRGPLGVGGGGGGGRAGEGPARLAAAGGGGGRGAAPRAPAGPGPAPCPPGVWPRPLPPTRAASPCCCSRRPADAVRDGSEEHHVVDHDVDHAAVAGARRGRELPLNAGQPRLVDPDRRVAA